MGDRKLSRKGDAILRLLGRMTLAGLLVISLSPTYALAEEVEANAEIGAAAVDGEVEPDVALGIAEPWSVVGDAPEVGEGSVAISPAGDVQGEGERALGLLEEADIRAIQSPSKNTSAPDFQIKGLNGKTASFNTDYKNKARVIIVGRSTCPNTSAVSASMVKLLTQKKYAGLQGVVLCFEEVDESGFKAKYGNSGSFNVVYGADGDAYQNLSWDLYRKAGFSDNRVMLPFAFFVDEDNAIRYVSTGYLSERDLASTMSEVAGLADDPAEKTVAFKISGIDKQSQGRALLARVNAARKSAGAASLAWSEALEKTAQQRAAELAIYYSHTRPDGTECFTAFPSVVGAVGENMAIGYSDAQAVNEAWTNSPGHYANMVETSFSSMASACFAATRSDGASVNCWVEVFAGASGSGMTTKTSDKKVVKDVFALQKNLALDLKGVDSMQVGDASEFKLCNVNREWNTMQVIEPASASWSSSKPSIASVDGSGRVSAKQAGSTTVKAALGEVSASRALTVSKAPEKPVAPEKPRPSVPDKPGSSDDSQPSAPVVLRLAGATALDTMTAITKKGFASGSCDTVVVATMGGYWDALTASALAGLKSCPIVLTDGVTLSSQAAAEVKRLGASRVYITGGSAAISKGVEASLAKVSGVKSVKRLAGDIAVNTALEIYREGRGSWGKTAVVATSETFQDALSVSPYAYARKAPIFLANASTHKLDPQVLGVVKQGGFDRVIIVGGTAALSSQIESDQLRGIACERLAGPTAYETSSAIASWCVGQGMKADGMGIATGSSYYDALAGASLCGKGDAAIVLVSDDNRSTIGSFVAPHKKSIKDIYVFGGSAAVSEGTYDVLVAVLR